MTGFFVLCAAMIYIPPIIVFALVKSNGCAKNTKKEKACRKGSIEKYAKSLILQAFSGQHDRQKKIYFFEKRVRKKEKSPAAEK
ncbi:MAG: hypothetical protein EGQ41_08760 [Clostridiales bacterium]|nr:hypothetical protein [Clostridiales bacterium]